MTNKKPVIPDAKSRTGVAISESAILSPENTPEILTSVGGFVTNKSKKKILKKNIEHNGGDGTRGRPITAAFCLESMRASSPTRIKSETSPQESDDPNPRIKPQQPKLPSALKKFDEITAASKGKQIVMFLDYDGTLSPIVEDPDRAFMTNEMRAAVNNTARYFPTAIVSGRCRDKVYNFVKLAEMIYAGSHGMDIQGPTKGYRYKKGSEAVFFQPAREHLPMIDEVHETLSDITKSITGAKVENNKFCVSVHFRCVDEKNWAALSEKVAPVVNKYPKLILTFGRKVLEIRPNIEWDKGKAVEFLLESLGYANSTDVLPVYIGDDRTDEDAFKVLESRGLGFGILVSKFPKDTSASYSLQEPSEVEEFLCRLVEWMKMGMGGDQGNIRCNI